METLRQLQTKSLNADLYKTELSKHENDLPAISTPAETKLVWYGIGALTGIALCSLVRCF